MLISLLRYAIKGQCNSKSTFDFLCDGVFHFFHFSFVYDMISGFYPSLFSSLLVFCVPVDVGLIAMMIVIKELLVCLYAKSVPGNTWIHVCLFVHVCHF